MSLTGLLFLVPFLALLGLALARHPIYGLMAYLAAFYVHPPSRWWGVDLGDWRWSLLAAAVTVVSIWIHGSRRGRTPFFKYSVVWLLVVYVLWLVVQSPWALVPVMQSDLMEMYAKFIIAIYIVVGSIDSEKHLRWFFWAHFLGCLCLSIIANENYTGGRFDSFGGPGIADANSAANQLVTGVLVGASLLLAGRVWGKIGVLVTMPFVVNTLVMTGSRSGFLAFVVAGIAFNLLAPTRFQKAIRVASILGVALFALLAGQQYWERMATIRDRGADTAGIDTSGGRVEIIRAQWRMFEKYPLGCGHRCTGFLSYQYLGKEYFWDVKEGVGRTSHNTFMTSLVEQGIPGAVFYVLLLAWFGNTIRQVRRRTLGELTFVSVALPAVAGSIAAVFVSDMFVDLLKHEVRIWLVGCLIAMNELCRADSAPEAAVSS
jgi:hypothetical protein